MRDRHCLQCGVFIRPVPGWKNQSSRRGGGLVHDTCLDKYIQHKKIISNLRKRIRIRRDRKMRPEIYRKRNADFYRNHKQKIRTRNYIYYHTNKERLRAYQRGRYELKHYFTETDNEFIVKVWPKWKTQGGWII